MADLNAQFEQAVAESKNLPDKPDNMTLLNKSAAAAAPKKTAAAKKPARK